jgi:ribosomal protein S17E
MGRVRPVFIKKISHELMKKYSSLFSKDFEVNKTLVSLKFSFNFKIDSSSASSQIRRVSLFKIF